jgi:Mrp family chromosome partitioning ATPase
VTDACILGAMCDQTLLVVRLHRTPIEVVDRAKRLLRAANCEVAGVVLTHLAFSTSKYLYRYGYAYTYT